MGLSLTLVFIILVYLSPAETFPVLIPFRPMLLLVILGSVGALLTLLSSRKPFWVPQVPLLLLFVGWVLFSLPLHGWLGGIVVASTMFLPSAVSFFLVMANAQSTRNLRWVAGAFVMVGIYFGFRALLAYFYGWDAERFTMQQPFYAVDPVSGVQFRDSMTRTRALGILGDPNDLAQNFLICLAFIGMAWKKRNPVWNLLFVLVPSAFILYSIYLTGSRGSLIGLFVLVALALKPKLGFAGPVASAAFTAVLVTVVGFGGGRAFSATGSGSSGRLDIWSDTITLVRDRPILGIGFHLIQDYTRQTTHNSFLLCAAELGLPGYFLFLALIVVTIIQLNRVRTEAAKNPAFNDLRQIAHCTLLAFYTFLASAWFLSRTYIATPFLIMGMGAAVYLIAQNEGVLKDAPPLPDWVKRTLFSVFGTLLVIYILVRVRWLSGA